MNYIHNLHMAIDYEDLPLVSSLLEAGLNPNIQCSTCIKPCIPLHAAVRSDNLAIVTTLLKHGANINSVSEFNGTILHVAVFRSNEMVELLLKNGANPNIVHGRLGTPLGYMLSVTDNIDMVKLLVSHGADTNIPDDRGYTAFHKAICYNRDTEIIKLLLDHGGDVNSICSYGSILHIAVCMSSSDVINLLIDHGANINALDTYGYPPLYRVVITDRIKIVKLLLDRGSDPNIGSNAGRTPLHGAVLWMKPHSVKLLLKYGADVNYIDNNRQTPITYIQEIDDDTAWALVSHIAILESCIANINKNSGFLSNLNMIRRTKKLYNIKKACDREIIKMRAMKIGNSISFEKVLFLKNINVLARFVENPILYTYISEMVIYHDRLIEVFTSAKIRYRLLKKALTCIESLLLSTLWDTLPLNVKYSILELLSDSELENIIT